ncbi:MAG: exosortase [Deltaproteobacteria bacterium]|nr:exosortase [Deltaproteobacteria bacterium]
MFALALLGLGVVSLYWTVVPRMVHDWWKDPNFSHGFLVPVFSAYLIHEKSRDLRLLRPESSATAGLFLVVCGLAMLIVGKAGGEYFTMRSSIVVLLSGIFFIMFGKEGFLLCLFPLMFLFFMVPIPYILYDAIAFPLKMAASWIGEHALSAVGIPVLRDGNIIMLPNIRLEVADACSGIRSLMSLMALATVASYFLNLRIALGAVLFVSSVPVSVGTNSLRIFATGILSNRYGEKAAEGFFHDFSGWLVFAAGAFVILLIGVLLRKIRDSL